jgi:hypothetical protein
VHPVAPPQSASVQQYLTHSIKGGDPKGTHAVPTGQSIMGLEQSPQTAAGCLLLGKQTQYVPLKKSSTQTSLPVHPAFVTGLHTLRVGCPAS